MCRVVFCLKIMGALWCFVDDCHFVLNIWPLLTDKRGTYIFGVLTIRT
jgi:hypothetical protein